MIELTCQSCGEQVKVRSLLAAAQQPCRHCRKLLMGPLSGSTRTVRPPTDGAPAVIDYGGGSSSAGMWLGILAGMAAGVGVVVGLHQLGTGIPFSTRNAILGAFSGALLAPVLAISSFVSMMVLPFSLEG